MGTPFPEYNINKIGSPADMQWLKPLCFLVGGLATFPFLRRIIVHNHRIATWNYDCGLLLLKPPDKEFMQNLAVQLGRNKEKFSEKPLHLMRCSHFRHFVLQNCSISMIAFLCIESCHRHVCPIKEKCKYLL